MGLSQVMEQIGEEMACRLALPETSKIHHVFHISQLKKALGNSQEATTLPPQISPKMELVVEPEALLAVRNIQDGQKMQTELLIKWAGLTEFEATWESAEVIKGRFSQFHP